MSSRHEHPSSQGRARSASEIRLFLIRLLRNRGGPSRACGSAGRVSEATPTAARALGAQSDGLRLVVLRGAPGLRGTRSPSNTSRRLTPALRLLGPSPGRHERPAWRAGGLPGSGTHQSRLPGTSRQHPTRGSATSGVSVTKSLWPTSVHQSAHRRRSSLSSSVSF